MARAQAGLVAGALAEHGVPTAYVPVTTRGDVDPRELTQIGGTGVFVGALREALYDGRIDVAVHSLKDLPTARTPDLELAAIPTREDVRDVLIGTRLDRLVDGTRIGTGSPRRAMQLYGYAERAGVRLEVVPIRGNVDTRIGLVSSGAVDAVVLAAAGLVRLGRLTGSPDASTAIEIAGLPAQVLPLEVMLPAPGQGALALEIHRSLSKPLRAALAALDDPRTRVESLAERGFLAGLEAGCTAPVATRARLESVRGSDLDLTLEAVIGRTLLSNEPTALNNGHPMRRELRGTTTDPEQFGVTAAGQVLAELRDTQRARHHDEAEQDREKSQ